MLDVIMALMFGQTESCPVDMEPVNGSCVDRYEAPNQKGSDPLVMKTAFEAEAWCEERGKRLCTINEWVESCRGTYKKPPKVIVESGVVKAPGVCNNDKAWILPDEDKLTRYGMEEALVESRRLWQGDPSGSRTECVSKTGVYDTIGNVEEWVRSPDDKYGYALMGHYWSRASTRCSDRVTNHSPNFYFYTTGFRCCSKPHIVVDDDSWGTLTSFIVDIAEAMKSSP